ncbi:hypothetical protein AAG906_005764 [Vitis piasezkii]
MEEEAKPIRQLQRRLNPHLQEVVRAEVLKLLQAGIIYPISDSPWVSPTQVVPKKSGITVVQNEKGEEITTRLTSGWRVCIDYRKLNAVTRKDHFPLPFIDQVLERVSGHPFYCMSILGYFQIEIDVVDRKRPLLHVHLELMLTEECLLVYRFFTDALKRHGAQLGEMSFYSTSRNCLWPYHLEKGIEVDKARWSLLSNYHPQRKRSKAVPWPCEGLLGHLFSKMLTSCVGVVIDAKGLES